MKKNLSLLMLLLVVLSCRKQDLPENNTSPEKTISMAEAMMKSNKGNSVSLMTASVNEIVIPLDQIPPGPAWDSGDCFTLADFAGYQLIRVHGKPGAGPGGFGVGGSYLNYNNFGSTIAFKYPFKYGKTYRIMASIRRRADEVEGDMVSSPKRKPTLEVQMTNSITPPGPCGDATAVNLTGDPVQTIAFSSDNYEMKTISFTPDKCMNYLLFNTLPNTSGTSRGGFSVAKLSIVEESILEVAGPDLTCINSEGDFSARAFGLLIADSFDWTVTGGLQIIGSATGNTVKIKSDGTGGSIVLSRGDCQSLVVRKVVPSPTPTKIYGGLEGGPTYAGNSYGYFVPQIPGVSNYEWSVTYGTIVSGQGTPYVEIRFPFFRGNRSQGYIVTLKTSNSCGVVSTLTGYGIVNACNNCPIN